MGGISADDPDAVKKLTAKLEKLTKAQETMKAVNAYYRKYKSLILDYQFLYQKNLS